MGVLFCFVFFVALDPVLELALVDQAGHELTEICLFLLGLKSCAITAMRTELYTPVLVRVTIAMMKHLGHSNLRKDRIYSAYSSTSQFFTKGSEELKQGRNLRARADAEATEKCCLLAWSS